MSVRAVNNAILLLVTIELLSGVSSFLVGSPDGRWVLWLHRIGGFAIVTLLLWKWQIAARLYRRRGLTFSTAKSGLLGVLLLSSLATGILWATAGLPSYRIPVLGTLAGLGFHVALSIAIIPLFLVHVLTYWPRPRPSDFASRRALLRTVGLSTAGLVLWLGAEGATAIASLSGSRRRFTGSRERGSLSGNGYPRTNWFSDPFPRLDADAWRLQFSGDVERAISLSLDDVLALPHATHRAILDCTGGWFTEQDWTGVPLPILLEHVGAGASASSVVVRSATGYSRRFALDEIEDFLIGTHVGGEPLSHGHGYPTRLVAPEHRGFEWVKWVVALEVSDEPAWWQAPLPLQ